MFPFQAETHFVFILIILSRCEQHTGVHEAEGQGQTHPNSGPSAFNGRPSAYQ